VSPPRPSWRQPRRPSLPRPRKGTPMTDALKNLDEAGVSIGRAKRSRQMLPSRALQALVERHVTGVTTDPTIFAPARSAGQDYDDQLADLARRGASVGEAIFDITTDDVRAACDVLSPVYERTNGEDGRVSIEVQPGLAYDTSGTISEARELATRVDRPGVMVK